MSFLNNKDVSYGKRVYETDENLELFKQFQEKAPSDFSDALFVWISDWAKHSNLNKNEQLMKLRSFMRVLSFPLAVFLSAENSHFSTLNKSHIVEPVRIFSASGVMGHSITEDEMRGMLLLVNPDFSDYLQTIINQASFDTYMNRMVYWITFGLLEALDISTADLLSRVLALQNSM